MKQITRTLLTLALLTTFASIGQAKEVFTEAGQLLGTKYLVSYMPSTSPSTKSDALKASKSKIVKQVQEVEFLYLGDLDLLLIQDTGVTHVRETQMGVGEFNWEDDEGNTYHIPASSFDSNSKYIIGAIHTAEGGKMGKFYIANRYAEVNPAQGRYFGEMVFPGGTSLSFGLNVAGTASWYSSCLPGSLPAHVEFAGYGYQLASLTHCVDEEESFNHGYSLGTFLWDDVTGALWYISLFEGYLNDAGWLEGNVQALPVLTAGDMMWGKFILQPRNTPPFN